MTQSYSSRIKRFTTFLATFLLQACVSSNVELPNLSAHEQPRSCDFATQDNTLEIPQASSQDSDPRYAGSVDQHIQSQHSGSMTSRDNEQREDHSGTDDKEKIRLATPSIATQYGFYAKEIDRDGNCLFKAVADQLQNQLKVTYAGRVSLYLVLRRIAANHIICNAQHYKYFTTSQSLEEVEKLIQALDKDREWAGDEALAALSRALQLTIVVLQETPRKVFVRKSAADIGGTVYLHYVSHGHYQSLYRDEHLGNVSDLEVLIKTQCVGQDFVCAIPPNLTSLLSATAQCLENEQKATLSKVAVPYAPVPVQLCKDHFEHMQRAIDRDIGACLGTDIDIVQKLVKKELRLDYRNQLAALTVSLMSKKPLNKTALSRKLLQINEVAKLVQAAHFLAPEVCDLLLKLHKDANWRIRSIVVSTLGELIKESVPIHNQASFDALLESAEDTSDGVRSAAIEALGKLTAATPAHVKTVLNVLLKKTKDRIRDVRKAVADTLNELLSTTPWEIEAVHYMTCLNVLLETAKDSDKAVRESAKDALKKLVKVAPTVAILKALLDVAKGSSEYTFRNFFSAKSLIQQAIVKIKEIFYVERNGRLERHLVHVRSAAVIALGTLTGAAPTHAQRVLNTLLEAAKDAHPLVRSAAVDALIELVKAMPTYSQTILNVLQKALQDSSKHVRKAAVYALVALAKAAPIHTQPVLKAILDTASDVDIWIRLSAADALKELVKSVPTKNIFKTLLEAAEEANKYTRLTAITALGALVKVTPTHTQVVLKVLLEATKASDPQIRGAVVNALGSLTEATPRCAQEVLKVLFEMTEDPSDYVRGNAAEAIGTLASVAPAHTQVVLKVLFKMTEESSAYVREAIALTLGALVKAAPIHAHATLKILLEMKEDSNRRVRKAVAGALGVIQTAIKEHKECKSSINIHNPTAHYQE